jgi:hypothetical protein
VIDNHDGDDDVDDVDMIGPLVVALMEMIISMLMKAML